jgi:hypothetical protein
VPPADRQRGAVAVGEKKFLLPRFEVPHRVQPTDLVPALQAGYLKGLSDKDLKELKLPPQLGGKLDPPAAGADLGRVAEAVAGPVGRAAEQLFSKTGACAKCHQMTGRTDPPAVAAVPDRTVWFTHAKFNHASHRGATCATCHPGTGAAFVSKAEADKPEPVQILGVNTCRACHAPPGTTVKLPTAARSPAAAPGTAAPTATGTTTATTRSRAAGPPPGPPSR